MNEKVFTDSFYCIFLMISNLLATRKNMKNISLRKRTDFCFRFRIVSHKEDLCFFYCQVSLCGTQFWWTTEVGISFNRLEEGYENAMKEYNKKQVKYDLQLKFEVTRRVLLPLRFLWGTLSVLITNPLTLYKLPSVFDEICYFWT